MKRLITCLFVLASIQKGNAQANEVKRLHIGDTMPSMIWPLLNSKNTTIDLGKVHNKVIILSFWTPSCSFSAGQLSELYHLAQSFPHDVTLLPVAFDGQQEGATKNYLAKRKGTADEVKTYTALQPFSDDRLYRMLPFIGLPQNVWLDSNHVIKAITDHLPLTEENIHKIIAGKNLNLELKDYDYSFDVSNPLLVNNNGGPDSTFSYRSLITAYNPYISLGNVEQHTDNYTRIAVGNTIPVVLFQTALIGSDTIGLLPDYDPMSKRFINRVSGNDLFRTAWYELPKDKYEQAGILRKRQAFCYDLVMPPTFSSKQAYQKMVEDLCAFFQVKAHIEQIPVKTLQLTITSNQNCKQGELSEQVEEHIIISENHLSFSFEHCTLNRLSDVLNMFLELPVIRVQSHGDTVVSLSFQLTDLKDLPALRREFEKCGITIDQRDENIGMMIVENK